VHRHCVAQYSAGKALKERLPAIVGSSNRNHPLQLGGNRSAEALPDTVKQVVLQQGCQASGCPTGPPVPRTSRSTGSPSTTPPESRNPSSTARPVLPPRSCSMPLGTMNRGWTQSIAPEVEAAVRRLAAVAAMHARCISTTGAVSTVPCAVQQSVLATEDDGGAGRRGDGHRRGPDARMHRSWRDRELGDGGNHRSRRTPP
jgi:hypothetical protein